MKQDVPPIIAHLNRLHYASPEWSRDARITDRGLGSVEAHDDFADKVYQLETISKEYNR